MSKKFSIEALQPFADDMVAKSTPGTEKGTDSLQDDYFMEAIASYGDGLTKEEQIRSDNYRAKFVAAAGIAGGDLGRRRLLENPSLPSHVYRAGMSSDGSAKSNVQVVTDRQGERVQDGAAVTVHGPVTIKVTTVIGGLSEVRAHALAAGARELAGK